jgi:uncharacterized protein YdeI (YjbR/CyaY-like superfamily)
MPTTDPRIDAYIDKAADFARPILREIRAMVSEALPDSDETIKWGMPAFTVHGKNVAGMAAFKAHCALTVHGEDRPGDAMGQYGRVRTVADLPSAADFAASLRAAVARIEARGTAMRTGPRAPKPEIAMPDDFAAALAASKPAEAAFERFAPSHRREYLEWVTEAKRPETRAKRIAQAVEWIGEGKKRNWKYENC